MKKNQKLKIFNDPVYGFVSIPDEFILELIEHRYFQRLRRISQTGLSNYVYPGCTHSRFSHALGCLHLMQKAINTYRLKQIEITPEEEQAVYIAILLHDIGHGPFSHTLESTIVEGVHHEDISLRIMQELNQEFSGKLDLAIQLFQKKYHKKFLYQLIASQLDIDRLDYLKRDSFFTGVAEGNINSDRIISMMNVSDNQLVIDEKGIYSVEKFLISRMFMYWQVYLHKTSLAAEIYLIQTLKRAKELAQSGASPEATPALSHFLNRKESDVLDLEIFSQMDDNDIVFSLKLWQNHPDKILNLLAKSVIERRLPRAEIRNEKISPEEFNQKIQFVENHFGSGSSAYFVHETLMSITPYTQKKHPILLLNKKGLCVDIASSEKQILTRPLFDKTEKHHFCYWSRRKLENLMK